MKFEDLQSQWQKEGGNAALQISYDILFKEIRRNKNYFDAMFFWRDVREIGVGLVLIIFFLVVGLRHDAWPNIVLSGCILFVCLFLFIDRIRSKKNRLLEVALKDCVGNSLAEVNHQIWLLRNVFWWYLLPILLGIVVFNVYVIFSMYHELHIVRGELKTTLASVLYSLISFFITTVIFWGIYRLNQYAVKKELLPRKKELEELLSSINNGGEKPPANAKRTWPVVFLSLVITLFLSALLLFIGKTALKSPLGAEPNAAGTTHALKICPSFGDTVKQIASEKKMPPLDNPYLHLKELKVLSARYGAKNWWVDVTQKAVEMVRNNILFIASGNQLTDKEPPDGSLKTLEIKYLLDGQPQEALVREGTLFTIPAVLLDPNDERRVIETDRELYRLAEACPAELGFYGKSFTTGKELAYRPDQPACLASIVKIFVLLALSRQIEDGQLNPQDSVTIIYKDRQETCSLDKAVDLMIGLSDNEATAALAKLVGYDRVNALADQLSMKGISRTILPEPGKLAEVLDMRVFRQRMVPPDQLPPQHGTARGIVSYFELLNKKRLVNEAVSKRVLEALERNPMYYASNATPSGYQSVGKGGSILWIRPPRPVYNMVGWGVYIYNEKEALAFCIWAEWFPKDMDESQRWQWMTGLSNCIVNLLLQPENRTWNPQANNK